MLCGKYESCLQFIVQQCTSGNKQTSLIRHISSRLVPKHRAVIIHGSMAPEIYLMGMVEPNKSNDAPPQTCSHWRCGEHQSGSGANHKNGPRTHARTHTGNLHVEEAQVCNRLVSTLRISLLNTFHKLKYFNKMRKFDNKSCPAASQQNVGDFKCYIGSSC